MTDHPGGPNTTEVVCSHTGRSVGQCQMATVDRVRMRCLILPPWHQQQRHPRLPFPLAPCTTATTVPRDYVVGGGMVPDCDCVLKFPLMIINWLIHNWLSIMEINSKVAFLILRNTECHKWFMFYCINKQLIIVNLHLSVRTSPGKGHSLHRCFLCWCIAGSQA